MTDELITLLDNEEVGRVRKNKSGKLSFVYNENWRKNPGAYPISLSIPLTESEHGHAKIDPFLWGLLPDNARILESWAQSFSVSARNAFGLISNVGEDCPGAIQFVRPEKLSKVLAGTSANVDWLTEQDIADRLRILVRDHAAWRIQKDTGHFSLAGAQPKTAFLFQEGRWGVPSGRTPTTHIFKPPMPDFDGHVENEHFCLRLASQFGILVPESKVVRFQDQIAIVITRYDRIPDESVIRRVHQEDMCQAFGLPPTLKYEADGGPGASKIAELIRTYSLRPTEDIDAFVDALGFNWLVGGGDAHAKNYSVLIASGTDVRLAPIYDVASILAYERINPYKVKLAMKIGGTYRLRDIGPRQWYKLATGLHLNPERVLERLKHFAKIVPDYVTDMQQVMHSEGLRHPLIDHMAGELIDRARQCTKLLEVPVITEKTMQ
jgi:serine/threonine-protein kinase HipA